MEEKKNYVYDQEQHCNCGLFHQGAKSLFTNVMIIKIMGWACSTHGREDKKVHGERKRSIRRPWRK
jgi:hypothetical protein